METWMVLVIWAVLVVGLTWLARTDTKFGRALRRQDHEAWAMAMEKKQAELEELRKAEPHRGRDD